MMYPMPEWKRRMKTGVSNAEIQIASELGKADECRFQTQIPFCLLQTIPDFFFPNENIAVYIDGEQVHKHPERDDELRSKLRKRYGCRVLEYRYKAPLSKAKLREIVDNIVDNVKGQRKDMR